MAGLDWPAPTGSPIGTRGWFLAADGQWYRSDEPPAPGYHLDRTGRWVTGGEPWRSARWGLGDVWLCVLGYVVAGALAGFGFAAIDLARGGEGEIDDSNPYMIGVFVACNAIAMVLVLSVATYRKGNRSFRTDFGLSVRWLDPLIGLGVGIAGLIGAGLVGYGIDSALGADDRSSNIPVDDLTTVGQFTAFFVAVAVVTPVIEELVFRGLLARSLLKRGRSAAVTIAMTTALFVVPHLPAAESAVELASIAGSIGVLGLAFHLASHWTGNRLAAPIVAHALVNGLAAITLIAT